MIEFSRAYMEYQSQTARDTGHMLQCFYGPQMTSSCAVEDAPGILEHYTADGLSYDLPLTTPPRSLPHFFQVGNLEGKKHRKR